MVSKTPICRLLFGVQKALLVPRRRRAARPAADTRSPYMVEWWVGDR